MTKTIIECHFYFLNRVNMPKNLKSSFKRKKKLNKKKQKKNKIDFINRGEGGMRL